MATTQLEAYNTISVLAGADLTASSSPPSTSGK